VASNFSPPPRVGVQPATTFFEPYSIICFAWKEPVRRYPDDVYVRVFAAG
jgi:hypothetical protein